MDTVERVIKERRKYPRIKENIFIFCRFKGKDKIIEAVTENISSGGLMFESEESILSNRTVEVELYEPVAARGKMIISMSVEAKIVWVKEIEESSQKEGTNRFKIGARFSTIQDRDRGRIIAYAEEKLKS